MTTPSLTDTCALRAEVEDLRRQNAALEDLVERALATNLQQARRIAELEEAAADARD